MNRFRFIKVREVVSPNRANPNDAGLDFYVPTDLYPEDIHVHDQRSLQGHARRQKLADHLMKIS